jgi:hypothetical protein
MSQDITRKIRTETRLVEESGLQKGSTPKLSAFEDNRAHHSRPGLLLFKFLVENFLGAVKDKGYQRPLFIHDL